MERARRGLQDGGDRLATIARWLAVVPDGLDVNELVLEAWAGDEPPEMIRRWRKEKVSRELSHEINDLIGDHALDNGSTISARLSWLDTGGTSKLSKKFRALCPKEFQEHIFPLDGSQVSQLSANQRHTEAMAQKMIEATQKVFEISDRSDMRSEKLFDFIDRIMARLEQRAVAAEEIADSAAEEINNAEALAESATKAAEEAVQRAEEAGDDDKMAKVFDIAFKRLTEGG